MNEVADKVVYLHTRNDSGLVFYVGIGDLGRAADKQSRSKHWHSIVNKHGYQIVLLHKRVTWECACEWEKYYIKKLRAEGHPLVNLTDGGEGLNNPPPETREKLSKAKKAMWQDQEHRAKMSEILNSPEVTAKRLTTRETPPDTPEEAARREKNRDIQQRHIKRLKSTPEGEAEYLQRVQEITARSIAKAKSTPEGKAAFLQRQREATARCIEKAKSTPEGEAKYLQRARETAARSTAKLRSTPEGNELYLQRAREASKRARAKQKSLLLQMSNPVK